MLVAFGIFTYDVSASMSIPIVVLNSAMNYRGISFPFTPYFSRLG